MAIDPKKTGLRPLMQTSLVLSMLLGASPALAQTQITMWTFLDPGKANPAPREIALKQIIDDFQAANPGLKVVVEPQDFATMPTKFYLGHSTGQNPDIVWIDHQNLGGLLQTGAGANLDEMIIAGWPTGTADDFYIQAGWNAAVDASGVHRALPLMHGTTALYYRKDLFEKAGIDPASLVTWDDLIAAAQKLTVDNDSDGRTDVWGLGIPLMSEKTEVSPGFTSLAELSNPLFDGCTPNMSGDAAVKSLLLDASFIQTHKVTPAEAFSYNVDDVSEQFAAGRYAMAVTSALRFTSLRNVASFGGENIGLLPWPAWSAETYPGPTVVNGWYAAVWDKSPNKEAAAKFVEAMVSPPAVELWSKVGGQVPTRSSVLSNPFYSQPDTEYVQTLRQSWGNASFSLPNQCNVGALQADWNTAVQQVVQLGADPVAALEGALRKFQEAQP